MRFRQIQHNLMCSDNLCQLGKEYLNTLTYTYYTFSRQHSETFGISHAFLPLTITKLSTLKTVRFLPRDALLSAVYAVVVCLSVCLSVCVCVCHTPVLYQNG